MKHLIVFFGMLSLTWRGLALQHEMTVKDSTKLMIVVPEAQVSVVGVNSIGGSMLRISLDALAEEQFLFETLSDSTPEVIRISQKPGVKPGKDSKVKPKIEVSGRSLPVEVHLFEGTVSAQKWTRDLFLHVQKGKIGTKETVGSLVAHAQKGEINITEHQGPVTIDSLQAATHIRDLTGDVNLQIFQADATLEKTKGLILLNSNHGTVQVLGGSGTLQFETNKGTLQSQAFQGRVEGNAQEGSISVSFPDDADINIKTHAAKVSVTAPPNSGVLLNLATAEGEIYVPNYLKVSKDGAAKSLKGRLKGDSQKGTVVIRSQEGTISVR